MDAEITEEIRQAYQTWYKDNYPINRLILIKALRDQLAARRRAEFFSNCESGADYTSRFRWTFSDWQAEAEKELRGEK